jgi:hypothetical protein
VLSNTFSRRLHLSSFEHRATPRPGGRIVYRLRDGAGHVALPERDWEALCDGFEEDAKPFGRTANKMYFAFPFVLVIVGIILGQLSGRPGSNGTVHPLLWTPFLLLIFFGPTGIYLWHSYRIKALAEALEAKLRRYPRVSAPPARPGRIPRWLTIAVMLMVGPDLVFKFFGTLFPHAYDRSPWQGANLDLLALAGLILLAVYLLLRWRADRLARMGFEKNIATGTAEEERTVCRTDVVARARGE